MKYIVTAYYTNTTIVQKYRGKDLEILHQLRKRRYLERTKSILKYLEHDQTELVNNEFTFV